jgi:hypothetical protein
MWQLGFFDIARRAKAGAVEELFDRFDGFLMDKGHRARELEKPATTRSKLRARVEHVFEEQMLPHLLSLVG